MTVILADTSIWVGYLRDGAEHPWGAELQSVLDSGDLLICGPVVAELLAGTGDRDRERLGATLHALSWVTLGRREWIATGGLAAKLRRAGQAVALTDVEIALAAITAGARLLTADTDFTRIARLEPKLKLELRTR